MAIPASIRLCELPREPDIGRAGVRSLDGRVVRLGDGAFDRNTSCQPNVPVNYVFLIRKWHTRPGTFI